MSRPWDVVVVGAGIVGAAVARASAQAGLRTLLVEQEARGGQGTTGAATGHLVTLGETPAQLTLTRFALECWRRESARLPPSVHYLRRGTLWVAETPTEAERARRQAAELRAHAVEARWVPGEELRTLEPVLRPGLEGGLLVPGDGGVDPVAVTAEGVPDAASAPAVAGALAAMAGVARSAARTVLIRRAVPRWRRVA